MIKKNYSRFDNPRICVVLTAYNDEESIYWAVRDFSSQKNVVKVIVVNNNSTDETKKRANDAGAEVVTETQQGYGYACIRGLREALRVDGVNIIALAEGDGTFSGYDIHKMVPYLDNVDVVLGNRMTYTLVDEDSQQKHFLVWGNWFLSKLIQLRCFDFKFWGKCRIMDVGCTFKIISRDGLLKIIDGLNVGSYHFSPHMILVALSYDLSILEIPVTFHKRIGKSKGVGSFKRAIWIGLMMLGHILTYHRKKVNYPVYKEEPGLYY